MKKVLIVGSGGREFSIGISLKKDSRIEKLYFCPGNGATHFIGENVNAKDNQSIINFCINNSINLVIIGPEGPLLDGLSDMLRLANINVFGPSKSAAMIEGSKIFMKNLLNKYNIKTAKYIQGNDFNALCDFIDSIQTNNIVIKADGLCSGKGVIIATSKIEAKNVLSDMLSGKSFGSAGKNVVIEEFLDGYELSVFAISDSNNFIILPPSQDHKRLLDNNLGPNTGGMGAYSPTPLCSDEMLCKIKNNIIKPTLDAMNNEGYPFEGVLFCGIMIVNNEPYVLEFNARFGDPECEVLLPLLKTPFLDIIESALNKTLDNFKLELINKYCVGVVVASKEYPLPLNKEEKINFKNINFINNELSHISFGGIKKYGNNLYTNGGRIFISVGIGDSLNIAKDNAYNLIKNIHFSNMQYRSDIAYQALH